MSMDMRLNIGLGTIERSGGDTISLTRSERSALALLSANPHRVITREQLLDAVSEPGSDKSDRNVDFLINRLRRKLEDNARRPRFIATRYGEGYVWIADAPVSLQDIASADAVVGPVRGLEIIADPEVATEAARAIARALDGAFGEGKRCVYAPNCPAPDQFGARAPAHSAEITFFTDRGQPGCIVTVRDFRSGHPVFARRMGVAQVAAPGSEALDRLAADVRNAVWRAAVTAPARAEPLAVSLFMSSGESETPHQESPTASHRKLLTSHETLERKTLDQWIENERRLRALLDDSPDDAELKLLIALTIHSKYVMSGAKLFAQGSNTREVDEDEIESFVTDALPAVRTDPEYAIVAAKLLHFTRRGYDEVARELCEDAHGRSETVGRSLAIVGQMRAFFGETDAAVECLDQAIHLARRGSHAHLYALVMKCQALAAAARWDALAAARRELSRANAIAGFVLEPMFGDPEHPSIRSRALAFLLGRDRAQAMLMHKYYVSARLFRDPAEGASSMRSMVRVLTRRFGADIVPGEIRAAFPGLVAH